MGRVWDCWGNRHATRIRRKVQSTATMGGGRVTKVGHRPGVRLKWPRFRWGNKLYTLRPQSINPAISIRGQGGIRMHNENFCHVLINYAVRIVNNLYCTKLLLNTWPFFFRYGRYWRLQFKSQIWISEEFCIQILFYLVDQRYSKVKTV